MADIFEPLNLDSPSPLNPKTVTDDRTTLDGFQIYRGLTLYDKTSPAGVYVYTGIDNSNVADDWIRVDASGGLIDQEDGVSEVTWDSEATLAFAEGPTHVPGRIYEVDVPDTTFTTVPVGFGGTGATTAEAARTNLGITEGGGLVDEADGDALSWDSVATLEEATTSGQFVENRVYEVDIPDDDIVPIGFGGTGATTLLQAQTNLGITAGGGDVVSVTTAERSFDVYVSEFSLFSGSTSSGFRFNPRIDGAFSAGILPFLGEDSSGVEIIRDISEFATFIITDAGGTSYNLLDDANVTGFDSPFGPDNSSFEIVGNPTWATATRAGTTALGTFLTGTLPFRFQIVWNEPLVRREIEGEVNVDSLTVDTKITTGLLDATGCIELKVPATTVRFDAGASTLVGTLTGQLNPVFSSGVTVTGDVTALISTGDEFYFEGFPHQTALTASVSLTGTNTSLGIWSNDFTSLNHGSQTIPPGTNVFRVGTLGMRTLPAVDVMIIEPDALLVDIDDVRFASLPTSNPNTTNRLFTQTSTELGGTAGTRKILCVS